MTVPHVGQGMLFTALLLTISVGSSSCMSSPPTAPGEVVTPAQMKPVDPPPQSPSPPAVAQLELAPTFGDLELTKIETMEDVGTIRGTYESPGRFQFQLARLKHVTLELSQGGIWFCKPDKITKVKIVSVAGRRACLSATDSNTAYRRKMDAIDPIGAQNLSDWYQLEWFEGSVEFEASATRGTFINLGGQTDLAAASDFRSWAEDVAYWWQTPSANAAKAKLAQMGVK
jgi:hypothetical protein